MSESKGLDEEKWTVGGGSSNISTDDYEPLVRLGSEFTGP